ncbi:MAG: hypothetical protein HZA34_01405 [Candidatus Pacebacteria bacterium]|nr:hypothetical protein [Candidatus Paceibacterota bacterium]
MHKLLALFPLLGWFYVSIFVFVVFEYMTKYRFHLIRRIFYGTFGLYAVILSLFNLQAEVQLYAETKKTLFDRFEQKISYESGTYYNTYYRVFRPLVHRGQVVHLLNVSAREYHYARMYLFPSSVVISETLPKSPSLAVVNTSTYASLKQVRVLGQSGDKYLIQTEVGK